MKDWDVFRYVLAIDRHGGLSGAARALSVTHATVSRQLDRAETMLGAKLFDRMPSGLTPTQAGLKVIARANAAEREFIALDLSLVGDGEGPLSITAPPLMMRPHLGSDFSAFAAAHPGIMLHILSDNRVFDLHRREADLAVRVTRKPAESLWGRKVADQKAGYFASEAFLSAHRDALRGSSDAPVPVVSFSAWPHKLPKDLRAHLPGAKSIAVADDMMAGVELVKAGMGLSRIPYFVANQEPSLRLIETLPTPDYAPIWVLTHPDLKRTPIVRTAMQFLAERFAATAALYTERLQ